LSNILKFPNSCFVDIKIQINKRLVYFEYIVDSHISRIEIFSKTVPKFDLFADGTITYKILYFIYMSHGIDGGISGNALAIKEMN